MKKMNQIKLVIVIVGLLIVSQVQGQLKHHVTGSGALGYTSLFHSIEDSKVNGGFGFSLGAGYQLSYNAFLFNTGLEYQMINSMTKMNDFTQSYKVNNLPYDMIYHYNFSDFKDKQMLGFVNIPLLFGAKFDRYFFLAGAKVGLGLHGNSGNSGNFTTTITDGELIGDLENMPTHQLGSGTFASSSGIDVGLNIAASVEFGISLDEWLLPKPRKGQKRKISRWSYRASVFADYGVLNVNASPTTNTMVAVNDGNLMDVKTNSLLTTTKASGKSFNPFMVGAKFTVLFDLVKPKPPVRPKPKPKPQPKPQPKPVVVPNPVFMVYVTDADTEQPLDADIEIVDCKTSTKFLEGKTKTEDGIYTTDKLKKDVKYSLNVKKQGYIYYSTAIARANDTISVSLEPVEEGRVVVLRDVFFAFNETKILDQSMESLNELYKFLMDNPEVKIKIVGHTDNVGSESYNSKLSRGRAKSVVDELIKRGISSARLTYEGRGSKDPIADNSTEEGRAENRRVEFEVQ